MAWIVNASTLTKTLTGITTKIDKILVNQEKQMSATTDLTASVATLQASATAAIADINDLMTKTSGDDPAVVAAVSQINAITASLNAVVPNATPAPPVTTP